MAYETILTVVGLQKLASATPEQQLKINQIAVGDGNGSYSPLDPEMTGLVNEVWRGPASAPIRDRNDPTILIFEGIIPANVGGFFIREAAIFDDLGAMIGIGQVGVTEKPADDLGTALTLTVRFRMKLSNSSETNLVYNDSPSIDHAGLSNRDAPDSHPMSAITGLPGALAGKADKSTFVYAGTGLSGGGALSASVTLSVRYGSAAGTAAEGNDPRLSNSREWTAETVPQAEAEAGTATTRRAWTAQRVWQAIRSAIPTTAFTRTILSRSNAAQVRGDLQLGTAALLDVVESSVDMTAGRILRVGSMGLGSTAWVNNLDTLRGTRFFGFGRDAVGAPPDMSDSGDDAVGWQVESTGQKTQFVSLSSFENIMLVRNNEIGGDNTTSWMPWQKIYHSGNMPFATPEQAQALTADDVAITPATLAEAFRSPNSSLNFQRLPGGLMIQWGEVSINGNTPTTVTFPVAFPTNVICIVASDITSSAPVASDNIWVPVTYRRSRTQFDIMIKEPGGSSSTAPNLVSYIAIGV